ncbi:MAG TPA: TPM domain-containing protein [Bacteroidales bacterium]|nr:TPM domain-containing protein [Bacteroidales bacterium]HPS73196.1 TPM domain-containing protein [Bacteroidales bacterium]
MTSLSARTFFTQEQQEDIRLAIMDAELDTSGEIRVHIENTVSGDTLDRAAYLFKQLKMHETEQRNGVLIYLAIKNRRFAVIGDIGINQQVGEGFWDGIKETMLTHFREDRFTEGLTEAIRLTGLQLKKYFPYKEEDVNELSDEISFGH